MPSKRWRAAAFAVLLAAGGSASAQTAADGDYEGDPSPVNPEPVAVDVAVRAPPTSAGGDTAEGRRLYGAGRYAEAIPLLEQALADDPVQNELWGLLGQAYRRTGQDRRALETWTRLRLVNPEYAPVHYWLGGWYAEHNQLDLARQSLRESLRLDPAQPDGWWLFARVTRWSGRFDEARDILRRMLAAWPRMAPKIRGELARVYYGNRQYAEARPLWQELRRAQPDDPVIASRELCCRLYLATDPEPLLAEARARLEQRPEDEDVLRALADVLQTRGDREQAAGYLKRLLPIVRNARKHQQLLARVVSLAEDGHADAARRDSLAEAEDMLAEFMRDQPGNTDMRLLEGEMNITLQRLGRAEEIFQQVLKESNSQNTRALRGMFEIALARLDARAAEQWLNRVAAFNPRDPYLEYLKARLAMLREDYGAALEALDRLERAGARGAVAVLLYHGLTTSDWLDIPSVRLVREQVETLKAAGYRFISPADLPGYMAAHGGPPADRGAIRPDRVACVTFDDARRDAMRLGTPLFRELNIPAGMHVPVGYPDQGHPFISGWDELRTCARQAPWVFGGHSVHAHDSLPLTASGHPVHPLANRLWNAAAGRLETEAEYDARLDGEYGQCLRRLEAEKLAGGAPFFAYPFGDLGQLSDSNVTNAVARNLACAEKYYRVGFIQSYYGYAVAGDNPLLYQRTEPGRAERGAALRDRLLSNHPVFLARDLRARIAALTDKRFLARDTLKLLARDGYPADALAAVRAFVTERLGSAGFPSL